MYNKYIKKFKRGDIVGMFGLMETLFPIMFLLVFTLVLGGFIFTIGRGISTWHKNNNSPRLVVNAIVSDKHEDISHHHHNHDGMHHSTTSTSYYVTFTVEGGERLVLEVNRHEYGYLLVNDEGKLTFQGTRYLGFERE